MVKNTKANANVRRKSSEPKPKWTIMIYLAGDNSLTANCISVMQDLEAANPSKEVEVLACFDSNTPRPKGSRYLQVNRRRFFKNNMNWAIHNDLIPPDDRGHSIIAPSFCPEDRNNQEKTSSPVAAEGLSRFICWALDNYQADRYMLITFGHGGVVAGQTFLAKQNPASFLSLTDFHKILAKYFGRKNGKPQLDILACDNCVMNGLETAFEIREQADYMLGSQGLMLAVGWPYQRIINAIVDKPGQETKEFAGKILEVCARNLLDFALMDRSSEQAFCDLTKFDDEDNIIDAVGHLVSTLRSGLKFEPKKSEPNQGELVLRYPTICDAIRLARLEAQAFWGETFVDLYDFCERLMWKCDQLVHANATVLKELGGRKQTRYAPEQFRNTEQIRKLKEIAVRCRAVLGEVQRMVPSSYYIGADLQYSHGLSVYFPWTLPEKPYFFSPVNHGRDFRMQTAFETYKGYQFARRSGWAHFLEDFFRATLRKVRRADREFSVRADSERADLGLIDFRVTDDSEAVAINLQKSSSDVGKDDDCTCSAIKNYPRRNYLAPADCARRTDQAGPMGGGANRQELVSYLGWNVRGLVAKVIKP
jgi:Clostripain family